VFTRLIKHNPATFRRCFGVAGMLVTHELKLAARTDKSVSSFSFTVFIVTGNAEAEMVDYGCVVL